MRQHLLDAGEAVPDGLRLILGGAWGMALTLARRHAPALAAAAESGDAAAEDEVANVWGRALGLSAEVSAASSVAPPPGASASDRFPFTG